MIDLIIFDMGGVCVRNYNVAPALSKILHRDAKNLKEFPPEFTRALKAHCAGLITESEVWDIWGVLYGTNPYRGISLFERSFEPVWDTPTEKLITDLKASGYRVVCGTNTIDSHYRYHVQHHQYDIFDKVYASHLIHRVKPDSDFFTYILEEEQAEPAGTIFIDDSPQNVESARKSGINALVYTSAEELEKQLQPLLG